MASAVASTLASHASAPNHGAPRATHDPKWVRWLLTGVALLFLAFFLVLPLAAVFTEALRRGLGAYFAAFADPDALASIKLTLMTAAIAVPANLVFGIAAAWLITKFQFRGKSVLTTLIDLPFSVSPVVAGLVFVLVLGRQGYLGPWLQSHGLKILFATPGLILVTCFVTLPLIARELIPVMEAIGPEEELAALSLGANGWQMFRRITLPNIKWGLLYGVILCNARAMGEFGAVYVVSGRITGQTDTVPLRVEKLFQEYNTPGSFAVASVLTLLALATLVVKVLLERKVFPAGEQALLPAGQGDRP